MNMILKKTIQYKCFEDACDLGTYKTEEGILRAQEQPGLQSEFSHPELYNKTLSQ